MLHSTRRTFRTKWRTHSCAMSLSFPRSAQFSWGGSPEPRRAPSPGCLHSQQDPAKPTRASAAGQGSRPTKLSSIAHKCERYLTMKICILDDSYEQSGTPFKEFDFLPDPVRYLDGHDCERHFLHKATAVRQVLELSKRGFDVFLNLCDGAWDEDRPGIEVVQTLEKLNVPFTGATSSFFEPTRQMMKRICHYSDIGTPAHAFVSDAEGIVEAAEALRLPLIVKHPCGYASIGITQASRVETPEDLRIQAAKAIDDFGAALLEEFIEGREFTVLV